MTSEGPIDLIRLEGEGASVVVRITGEQAAGGSAPLAGEILVDTPFVRGGIATRVLPEDITEWQEALDTLDTGKGIGWREAGPATELFIDLDPDDGSAQVTVTDRTKSGTIVTVGVVLDDAWFDDAYRRLEQVREVWPPAGE